MKGLIKKRICVFSAIVVVASIVLGANSSTVFKTAADNTAKNEISNPRISNDKTTWDCIYFGNYKQNKNVYTENNVHHNFTVAPIKWRVLSVEGDNLMLLSDKVLDNKEYYEKTSSVRWNNCSLRDWLNGEFYNSAFSALDKSCIIKNQIWGNSMDNYNGFYSDDNVYILSYKELNKEEYGLTNDYKNLKQTDYVDYCVNNQWNANPSYITYWLRNYESSSNKSYVSNKYITSSCNGDQSRGVRPVIKIKTTNIYVRKAGTVSSDGTVVDDSTTVVNYGINAPRYTRDSKYNEPNNTEWDCVFFGKYPQTSEGNGYYKTEPIKWRVLSIDGSDAFLISDVALDSKRFHNTNTNITWGNCDLNKWLNDEFKKKAFNYDEQNAIINNRIEIPSTLDVSLNIHGFPSKDYILSPTRFCKPTDYAIHNGCIARKDNDKYKGNCDWWIISTYQHDNNKNLYLSDRGSFDINITYNVYKSSFVGVRPVLHLNLSKNVWTHAGIRKSSDNPIDTSNSTTTASGSNISAPKDSNNYSDYYNYYYDSDYDNNNIYNHKKIGRKVSLNRTFIKKIQARKKSIYIKWKKNKSASGYIIQYSTKRGFKNSKTKTIKSKNKTSRVIKKLKTNKKYYFRIRCYKKIGFRRYSSKWSNIKKCKTK